MSKCKYQNVNLKKILAFCILTFDFLFLAVGCKRRAISWEEASAPQTDTEQQSQVRVLLIDNTTTCTLKVASPHSITEGNDQKSEFRISNSEFSGQQLLTLPFLDQINVPTNIQLVDGKITIAGRPFTSNQVTVSPDEPQIFNLNGSDYRGKLQIIVNSDSNSFDVINIVPLEAYLAGVVGAEMPAYWEPEALKAQSIAARTYCLYIKKRFGANHNWDVKKTQANQVYLGVSAESPPVWEAVNQTQGQVLVCEKADGGEDIFPTYYSSSCGGHTENSNNVFGDSFQPLAGVICPYCKDVAKPLFFFWPMVQFDSNNITAKLSQRYPSLTQLGEISDITVTKQSDYEDFSRLTEVKLIGPGGKSNVLKAEDLRLAIDPTGNKIKSAICQIVKLGDKWAFLSGRGYGHGVGMCQCGAQAMARGGKTAEEILAYYYPGSKISTIRD